MTVDVSGNPVGWEDYYPYGMQMTGRSYTSSADQRYKFSGKERDASTGLDYFGARYYESTSGRWLSVDPMADKYPGWSSYNYVEDNPERNVDPDGMEIGDYYKQDGTYLGSDSQNDDKAYIASGVKKNEYGLVTSADNASELNYTNSELMMLAAVAFSESSVTQNSVGEKYGIASAGINNFHARKRKCITNKCFIRYFRCYS